MLLGIGGGIGNVPPQGLMIPGDLRPVFSHFGRTVLLPAYAHQIVRHQRDCLQRITVRTSFMRCGFARRGVNRPTRDLLITNEVLYPLATVAVNRATGQMDIIASRHSVGFYEGR